MARSFPRGAATVAALTFVSLAYAKCESFGIDFQTGGTYFQNNASTQTFTALQKFTGCQNDTAHNILVDPNGNQCECTSTPLVPDGKPQLVNCTSKPQDALFSGNWSLIIISNNGNGNPIAYQRDFSLDVGAQRTTTVTPVATVTACSTIIRNITTTSTEIISTIVPATTATIHPETTTTEAAHGHGWDWHWPFHHPAPTSSGPDLPPFGWIERPHSRNVKETKTLHTITETFTEYRVAERTVEPSCRPTPMMPSRADDEASIFPSVLPAALKQVAEKAMHLAEDITDAIGSEFDKAEQATGAERYRRAILSKRQPSESERTAFIAERNVRLSKRKSLQKRFPENQTVTVTATSISTTTAFGSPSTVTNVFTSIITSTSTISSGTATQTGSTETVAVTTLPTPIFTWTVWQPFGIESTTVIKEIPVTKGNKWADCAGKWEVHAND